MMPTIVDSYPTSGSLVAQTNTVSGYIASGSIVTGNISSGVVTSGTMPFSGYVFEQNFDPTIMCKGVDWFTQRGVNKYFANCAGFGSGDRWYVAGVQSRHHGYAGPTMEGTALIAGQWDTAIPYWSCRGGEVNEVGIFVGQLGQVSGAKLQFGIYDNRSGNLWPNTRLTASPDLFAASGDGSSSGVASGYMYKYSVSGGSLVLQPNTLYWFVCGAHPVTNGPYLKHVGYAYSPFGLNSVFEVGNTTTVCAVFCYNNSYFSGNYPLPDTFPTMSGGVRWSQFTWPAVGIRYSSMSGT